MDDLRLVYLHRNVKLPAFLICTQFSGHRVKIESLGFHHGCFPELRGRHPFCFSLDSAVIVIANILGNRLREGFKGGIVPLKSIEHFISQPRIKNDGLCFDITDEIVVDVNVPFLVIVHGIAFADLNFLNQPHQRGTV